MQDFKDMFTNKKKYYIKNINYKKLKKTDERAEINLKDTIEIESINKSQIVLKYKREIYHEPKSNYILTVEADIRHYFNKKVVDGIDLSTITKESIIEKVMEEPNEYLGTVPSVVSLLISEITGAAGEYPIITPPLYIEEAVAKEE